MLCGTEPFPTLTRAKKYKKDEHYLMKEDFIFIMKVILGIKDNVMEDIILVTQHLPVPVEDMEIEDMFNFADKNQDGKISYTEFEVISQLGNPIHKLTRPRQSVPNSWS